METGGYIIYRYNGRYYAKYNHDGPFPKIWLGQVLVEGIPKERKRYAEWLTEFRTKYQEVEESIFGKETPIEVTTIPFEEYLSVIPLKESSIWDREFSRFPTIWPPPILCFVDWTYAIQVNLDRELFSVDDVIHFPLSAIPDTWIRELKLIRGEVDDDDDDDIVLIPQAIDISYPKPAVDETHVQLYEKTNCSVLQLAKFFIKYNEPVLSTLSSWGPEDIPFRESAFVLHQQIRENTVM